MASKNAREAVRRLISQGATEGERNAARAALARLGDVENATIKAAIEVKLRRIKGPNSALTNPDAIKHFLKTVRGGETLSYRDLLSPSFATQDFYTIVDTLISLGVAEKKGSYYKVSTHYKNVFVPWYNNQITSLLI